MSSQSRVLREIARRRRRRALMIRRAIFLGILVLLVFFVLGIIRMIRHNGEKKEYTAMAHSFLINGEEYEGRALLLSKDGQEYIPLSVLAERFGVEEYACKRKHLTWDGEAYTLENDDILSKMNWGGPAEDFIRVEALSEVLGYTVLSDENGVRSIDNYPSLQYAWADSNPWIMLAMGKIGTYNGTNSREAFAHNYEQGMRVFESDISLTSDNVPVACEDWKSFRRMTGLEDVDGGALDEETFLAAKIYGQYTPLSYEDIFGLLVSNTDMVLVLDVGNKDAAETKKAMQRFLKEAEQFDASIFDRIVPQVMSEEALDVLLGLHDWDSILLKLDSTSIEASTKELVRHAFEKGIRIFAVDAYADDSYFIDSVHQMGGKVYLHYIDDAALADTIRQTNGIDGFYTNSVATNEAGAEETASDEAPAEEVAEEEAETTEDAATEETEAEEGIEE